MVVMVAAARVEVKVAAVRAAVVRAAVARAAVVKVAVVKGAVLVAVTAEERSAAHSRCNQFQLRTALACHTRLRASLARRPGRRR